MKCYESVLYDCPDLPGHVAQVAILFIPGLLAHVKEFNDFAAHHGISCVVDVFDPKPPIDVNSIVRCSDLELV